MEAAQKKSRKELRKEQREAKKQKKRRRVEPDKIDTTPTSKGESDDRVSTAKRIEQQHPNSKAKKTKAIPEKSGTKNSRGTNDDPYAHLGPDVAAAMRRDDEEIAFLEAKMGRDKSRLHREYARNECYGDDFGSFLDNLDVLVERVADGSNNSTGYKPVLANDISNTGEESDSDIEEFPTNDILADTGEEDDEEEVEDDDDDEEIVPMKDPAEDKDDDDIFSLERTEEEDEAIDDIVRAKDSNGNQGSESDHSDEGGEEKKIDLDHDHGDTYRPLKGEDIYGRTIDGSACGVQPKKYVPPHLRNKEASGNDNDNDEKRQETLQEIQRLLNRELNRLSEDTILSVAQALARVYNTYPTSDVNECILQNTRAACILRGQHLMTGLIPVYVAALAGVHVQKGDAAQLGEYLLEHFVILLWNELQTARELQSNGSSKEEEEDAVISKESCNLVLVLCYMYNFGLVHCSLIYDLVRNLIESFKEIDIEVLLLILSHCGRSLRSDDPSALKQIVLLVQQKSLSNSKVKAPSSRVEYMVSAMNDLKNNKRRKQDQTFSDKTSKLRKAIGHIKSNVASSSRTSRSSDGTLRISLQDILNADSKGRWWKVGASWAGHENQGEATRSQSNERIETRTDDANDAKLLKLASKYRMNTDTRRSIFCIIMGSEDFEDCFEKLVRAGMLKHRTERDTVRVLMECCGNEQSYNKFYSLLAARICEYQMQCKFSFQLAFWDMFKQFDDVKARKAANLAKLLFNLVAVHNCLRLHVLKAIDMAAPEELSETGMIFLTIFMSNLLDYFNETIAVAQLFASCGAGNKKQVALESEEGLDGVDEGDALQASLTVFLVQVMKNSPKYTKGSKFRSNLKAAIKACGTDTGIMG
jgi:nucleolar MIF4G domain-containing protein 1